MTFNKTTLIQHLVQLNKPHRIAFAASCCQRLLPNYDDFAPDRTQNERLLAETLDSIWFSLTNPDILIVNWQEVKISCQTLMPAADGTLTSLITQNVIAGFIYLLDCCITGEAQFAADTAQVLESTIDAFLMAVNSPYSDSMKQTDAIRVASFVQHPEFNQDQRQHYIIAQLLEEQRAMDIWLWQSPLMTAELNKQKLDIEALQNADTAFSKTVDFIRHSSRNYGIRLRQRGFSCWHSPLRA